MSAISFAPAGPPVPAQSGRTDLNGDADAGAQDVQKQQRQQDDASAQRLGAQLRQMFAREAVSGAVANSQAADATIAGAVSNARAPASAAISSSSSPRNRKPHGVRDGGNLGLQNAGD